MKFLMLLLVMFTANFAEAYVVPTFRDLKPASQVMLEKQTVSAPVVADADRLYLNASVSAAATTTLSTFLAQPDVPRNIVITTGQTTADCNEGNVVVSGTNYFGRAITESIAISENQSGATAGVKAFKTVTSVLIPIQDGTGCWYDVGVGDVLGLKRCMDSAGHLAWTIFDGVYEGTRATCVADADEVEKNTCDINGTLNGSKNVDFFFVQNFRCLP